MMFVLCYLFFTCPAYFYLFLFFYSLYEKWVTNICLLYKQHNKQEKHSEACNIKDFAVYESPLDRGHQFLSPALIFAHNSQQNRSLTTCNLLGDHSPRMSTNLDFTRHLTPGTRITAADSAKIIAAGTLRKKGFQ